MGYVIDIDREQNAPSQHPQAMTPLRTGIEPAQGSPVPPSTGGPSARPSSPVKGPGVSTTVVSPSTPKAPPPLPEDGSLATFRKALQNSLTSLSLYTSVFGYISQKLNEDFDSACKGDAPDLPWLLIEEMSAADPSKKSVQISLRPAAECRHVKSVLDRKILLIKEFIKVAMSSDASNSMWAKYLDADKIGKRESVADISESLKHLTSDIYDPGNQKIIESDLPRIQQDYIVNIARLNGIIDKLLLLKPDYYYSVLSIAQMPLNSNKISEAFDAVVKFLTGNAPAERRAYLLNSFIDKTSMLSRDYPNHESNKDRLRNISEMLQLKADIQGNPIFGDKADDAAINKIKDCVSKEMGQSPLRKEFEDGIKNIFKTECSVILRKDCKGVEGGRKGASIVLVPVCKIVASTFASETNFNGLDAAKRLSPDPKWLLRGTLLPMLMRHIGDVLNALIISVSSDQEEEVKMPDGQMKAMKPLVVREKVEDPEVTLYGAELPYYTISSGLASIISGGKSPVASASVCFNGIEDCLFLRDTKTPTDLFVPPVGDETAWRQIDLTTRSEDFKEFMCKINRRLNFRRKFRSLYSLTFASIKPLVMSVKAGGFGAINRFDPVKENEYRWSFSNDTYSAFKKYCCTEGKYTFDNEEQFGSLLAKYLGLEVGSLIKHAENITVASDPNSPPDVNRLESFKPIYQWHIEPASGNNINGPLDDAPKFKRYVLCNMPSTRINSGLKNFDLRYYRLLSDEGFLSDDQAKVLKSAEVEGYKNRPRDSDVPPEYVVYGENSGTTFSGIGVNLPIAFQLDANADKFAACKKPRGALKNKGNPLTSNSAPRESGAQVMAGIGAHMDSFPTRGPISASTLASAAMKADSTLTAWQTLKNSRQVLLPTDQEWCHLMGHGDGGTEVVANFVAGSKHANTEQLAIESGQRPTTQKPGSEYRLYATAYLMPNQSMIVSPGEHGSYLGRDDKTLNFESRMRDKGVGNKSEQKKGVGPEKKESIQNTKKNMPLAMFFRYKVRNKGKNGECHNKVLDYVFEGQSEFFDRNQYYILNACVRFLINDSEFLAEFKEFASSGQT